MEAEPRPRVSQGVGEVTVEDVDSRPQGVNCREGGWLVENTLLEAEPRLRVSQGVGEVGVEEEGSGS